MANVRSFSLQSPYDQQMEELKRRQRMAEMLQQQAMQPLESQMAGGMVVPISPVQGLAKMLQTYMTNKQLSNLEKKQADLGKLDQANTRSFIQDVVKGELQPMSPDEALRASLSSEPTEETRVPMDRSAMLATLLRGATTGTPGVRNVAGALLPSAMEQPKEAEYYDATEVMIDGKPTMVQYPKAGGAPRILGGSKPGEAAIPSAVAEYNFAKDQGYKGTFQQWQDRNVRATAPREPLEKIVGPDGKPVFVPASQAIGKTPFVGGAEPTQGEKQDAYNINRVVAAAGRIKEATAKDPSAIKPGYTELPLIGTKLQNAPRQVVAGAQGEMIDALVTLATGMSYTKDQLEAARAQYLPQIGDKPETLKSKQQALQTLVEAGRSRSGRAWTPQMDKALNEVFMQANESPPAGAVRRIR